MASFNPRVFTNPDRLKTIAPAHLLAFFDEWRGYLELRGVYLLDDAESEIPYDDLAAVLLTPTEAVPEEMVDALYYVHETATNESMEDLLDVIEKAGVEIEKDDETSPADLAVQVWLKRPQLLQRHHAEVVAFSRVRFTYFSGRRGKETPIPEMTSAEQTAMQDIMDAWFESKRRGKACRIYSFPRGHKVWFLVRHGMPMRREGRHQDDGGSAMTFYRPQKHDVVIYDGETDEMAGNAETKGERELYLKTFGKVLFGRDDYFNISEPFTLEPLLEDGPDALACDDVSGITGVRLTEVGRFWGGKYKEMEIRKATDLFLAFGDRWSDRINGGVLVHAAFKMSFSDSPKERTVTLRPANIARYERDADADLINAWLTARGFRRTPTEEHGDADEPFLEDD